MTKPFQQWKVLPHGKLTEVDENVLTVTGELHMPLGDLPRRMTVARLNDARLVVFSAIALDEVEMQALEDYGQPAFLVVPNDHHRLDARAWKERYPSMQVVAPEGSRTKVEEAVHVDGCLHCSYERESLPFIHARARTHFCEPGCTRFGWTGACLCHIIVRK